MSTELNSGTVGGFGHMGPNDPYNDGHSGSGSSGGSFNGGGNGGGQNRGQNQDRGRNPQRGNGGGRRESAPSGSMADALRKAGFGK